MSENLDLVRSIYADWERGEFRRVDWADPDIEYVALDGPEPGVARGLDGMAEAWGTFLRTWTGFRATIQACRSLDDERVLVFAHRTARARRSGLEVGGDGADLWHVREGLVTRVIFYWDRDRALADLGLEA